MAEFPVNMNGERNHWADAEDNPPMPAFRRGASHSQFQPENRHRVNDEQLSGFPNLPSRGFDLQTLDSSFARLSVLDSGSVRPQQFPLPDNRWSNRSSSSSSLHNQGIDTGGGYLFPPPPREIQPQLINNNNNNNNQSQRLPFQNYCVNGGSFGFDPTANVMLNNGFLNGISRDVRYFSRNHFLDQSPNNWDSTYGGYGSGINIPWKNNFYNPNNLTDPSPPSDKNLSIVSLAKDRMSAQQLQNNIIEGSQETIDIIFNDAIVHIFELMVDPFGNQVLHKLMEKCSSEQINQILDIVIQQQFRFVAMCNDPLGTRAIQLLLRCLRCEEQISRIVETTSRVALLLTRSNHAKHVILQCFTLFSPLQNRNLIDIIAGNCFRIAIDQHGCCMLQQCLSIGCNELKQRLIGEIIANAVKLCMNCYGNYVVQYVVELEDRDVTKELIYTLIGNYAHLSRSKYGSHAVQKFLKIKDIDSSLIVNDLLRDIDALLIDPFGNYVIQTAWFASQADIRFILWQHIQKNCQYMRCSKFGNKLLERLQL